MQYTKKSPYLRTSSSLKMAVRGGLTRFARPAGSPLTAFTVCPTGCRQLSNPRYVAVYTLSRRAPSATRTPHQIVVPVLLERALI
ncbi:hypothetical protein FV696_14115 [Shigella sonnei]|nr:hypothetical protein [Shigella sonnei]EFW3704414.1 hypothetical protein [Shigella sonnei]EFW9147644.1 hypothetical protein [Shigella sonnei]EFW9630417.1 hypothetical protein [Shigella sonnei]